MKERHIDYRTKRGSSYRIVYRLKGLFLWEWDVLLRVNDEKGDWCGMTFGWERTLRPKRVMQNILRTYSENREARDYGNEEEL